MSANDPDDYVRREIDWIEIPCASSGRFSASAWARRCLPNNWARRSRRITEGRVEVGYYPIRPTDGRTRALPGLAERVYHWHGEGFQLPRGAELLAEGDDFPVQAYPARSRVRLPVSS